MKGGRKGDEEKVTSVAAKKKRKSVQYFYNIFFSQRRNNYVSTYSSFLPEWDFELFLGRFDRRTDRD